MLANLQLALFWVALIGVVAGIINSTIGYGNLISFVALTTLLGMPALGVHLANQVCAPASFALAWRKRFEHQATGAMFWAGCLGACAGAVLLAQTSPATARAVAPWGILVGVGVLLAVPVLRRVKVPWQLPGLAAAGLWGGLVGPGVGSFVFVCVDGSRAMQTKNVLCLPMGIVVAVPLIAKDVAFGSTMNWTVAGVLAAGMLLGGLLGSTILNSLPQSRVVADGLRYAMAAMGGAAGVFMLTGSLQVTIAVMASLLFLVALATPLVLAHRATASPTLKTGLGVDSAVKGAV